MLPVPTSANVTTAILRLPRLRTKSMQSISRSPGSPDISGGGAVIVYSPSTASSSVSRSVTASGCPPTRHGIVRNSRRPSIILPQWSLASPMTQGSFGPGHYVEQGPWLASDDTHPGGLQRSDARVSGVRRGRLGLPLLGSASPKQIRLSSCHPWRGQYRARHGVAHVKLQVGFFTDDVSKRASLQRGDASFSSGFRTAIGRLPEIGESPSQQSCMLCRRCVLPA